MSSFFRARKKEDRKKAPGKLRRASRSVASAGASKFACGSPQFFIRLRSGTRFKRGNRTLKTGTP
jgi:hypothetical protein